MRILEHGQTQKRTLLFSHARQSRYGRFPIRLRSFLRHSTFFKWYMAAISQSTPEIICWYGEDEKKDRGRDIENNSWACETL